MIPRRALIVAHGSPADPAPQEAALRALAAHTAALLPGWQVAGATLATSGALETALAAVPGARVLPFFMAEGWFTRHLLPDRLVAAGCATSRQLPAFGHHPGLGALLASSAQEAAAAHGLPSTATLLLAAHGSRVSRASARRTGELARELARLTRFRIVTGYVEEAPFLRDAARIEGPALCLPLFATRASHVTRDIPRALEAAGFTGPLLPAIGEHAEVPRLLAGLLAA
ncbi:MAG: cobalamin biosynthesis protein CbiX [Gemmobacter sp.]|jgi:sirohydrochlorin ferrochelatase|nr:cobalamin biosynthesis protein CbiX [Gemmobacter sp.]